MAYYLSKLKDLLAQFKKFTIQQVPRDHNSNAYALAKLASAKDENTLNMIPVENLAQPCINEMEQTLLLNNTPSWVTPIATYLGHDTLPQERNESQRILRQAARYMIIDGVMYRRGYSMSLL